MAGMSASLKILQSSGGGCIPYVEYEVEAATDEVSLNQIVFGLRK